MPIRTMFETRDATMRPVAPWLALALLLLGPAALSAQASRPMVVVDEAATKRDEPTPHGAIGMSTAYRISDAVPGRSMEFRKRILHVGSAIGAHVIAHDEVYYVVSGHGEVFSGTDRKPIAPGSAAYLFSGESVGIRQTGTAPLTLIIAYPIPAK